jgi:hypothetical protein
MKVEKKLVPNCSEWSEGISPDTDNDAYVEFQAFVKKEEENEDRKLLNP